MLAKIQIIGNVGKDPEFKYTPSGIAVVNFSVACSKKWKDGQGNQQEKTVWYKCVAWRGTAETIQKYVHKGMQVYVDGEMPEANAYIDKEGKAAANIEITVDTIKFLGNRSQNGSGNNNQAADEYPMSDVPDWGGGDNSTPFE